MTKKNSRKYVALLSTIIAVLALLIGFGSQTLTLKANETRADEGSKTPWQGGVSGQTGKLRFGITDGNVFNMTTGPSLNGQTQGVPNVEYIPDLSKDSVVRHLYDYKKFNITGELTGNDEKHTTGTSAAFNILNPADYAAGMSPRYEGGGVVHFNTSSASSDRKTVSASGTKISDKGLKIELKMEANENSSAVKHYYTIINDTGEDRTVYPMKQIDTQLNYDDSVPIYSRGEGKGLYIENRVITGEKDEALYRLDYIMDVNNPLEPDVHAPKYYQGSRFNDKFKAVFGDDIDNQNIASVSKTMNTPNGELVYGSTDLQEVEDADFDSGMFMSWGAVTIPAGESYMMRYDVGIRPLAELTKTKTATNLTSTDGKNRVGDEIEYSITMESPDLAYYNLVVTDKLSEAFEHPTKDVTVTDVIGTNGNKTTFPITEVYDPATRTLTIPTTGEGLKLVKKGKFEIKFTVKLAATAAGEQIMNTAKVTGKTEEETDITEEVTTEKPIDVENTGRVIIKYQDEAGNEIHVVDSINKIVGEKYNAITKKIEINGYKYKEATGDLIEGLITLADKEVIFVYSENRFTLKQEVKDAKGIDAHNAAVDMGDILTYTTTVTSLLQPDPTPGAEIVYYDGFAIVANVSEHLTNIDGIKLVSTKGVELTGFTHNPVTNTITATLDKGAGITSDEDLVLTYRGQVKDISDVDIKAQATATGQYSDGMRAAAITSNEVVSKRGAGNLEFAAPAKWDFGEREISDKVQEYSLAKLDDDILVTDNRAVGSKWKLEATLTSNFTLAGSGIEMPNVLKYKTSGQLSPLELNAPKEIVSGETTPATRGKAVNVTENWVANKEGLVLVVPGSIAKKGTYEAGITWTVTDAP